MTDTPGTLEERLRRNSGWRNERHQCVTDPNLLTEAADEIARLYSLARANNDLARRYADEIASLRARVEAKNDADLDRHIFAWFNDIDCDEMRRCLEAYDARQALKDTPVE